MRYFDHDTNAWKDAKIGELCYDGGLASYGLYFVVLELIYENEGPVNLAGTEPLTKSVSRWFGVGSEWVASTVEAMCKCGLLVKVKGRKNALIVTSERAQANIERYHARCETARENGKRGGRKPSGNRTANQLGSKQEPTRKEKKRKEKVLQPIQVANTNGAGAAGGDAAPPAVDHNYLPACPECGSKATATAKGGGLKWVCHEHGVIEPVVKDFGDAAC